MADGTGTTLTGSLTGKITVLGKPIKHEFFIMDTLSCDMLLGMDILQNLNIKVVVNDHTLYPGVNTNGNIYTVNSITGLQELTPDQSNELKTLIEKEKTLFEKTKGVCPLIKHEIRLKEPDKFIKQRYRPCNPAKMEILYKEVDKMLKDGVIRPSKSPWNTPVVIATKKNGDPRVCIDFRKVNDASHKDAYPIPQVNSTLNKLKGARYISTIDLKNGYWQVPLAENSRPITAFTVPGKGLFEFNVMPFGLHAAPSTFQRLLDRVITAEMAPHVFAYLDDIVIVTDSFKKHMQILADVLHRLRAANLIPNWAKCQWARERLIYLGHLIDKEGLHTDPDRIAAVRDLPPPTTVKQLRRFLGLSSWYRRFIKDASKHAAPLNKLLKKNTKWEWGEAQQRAFEELKMQMTNAPVLACPDWAKTFKLQTDASLDGLGLVLTQGDGADERVIAYASKTLTKAEKNYSVTELECLAVKWGIWKMRDYLEGYHFIVLTDHQSLKWLDKIDNPSGRLARWAMELSQWDFEIKYRKGTENTVADALSRQPLQIFQMNQPITCNWYLKKTEEVRKNPDDNPEYTIIKDRLYRHILHTLDFNDNSQAEEWKICVPTEERNRVLEESHDLPTAGHLGVAKTLSRLARHYYWPGMLRDATKYVRSCDSCQRHKAQQLPPPGVMHATNVENPWEMVSVDIVVPSVNSNNGHNQLLVMQDRFTKWIELRPLRKATGPSVTRAVLEQVILRHGCPKIIVSDNGRQFISKVFTKLLKDCKIEHRRTPRYTPQCNPVERTNRVVKTMIKQYIDKSQKEWDIYLPEIAYAYNSAPSDSTGYSPAYLNTGREFSPPGSLNQEVRGAPSANEPARIKRIHDAFELARSNIARSFDKQKRQYDLRRRDWSPAPGDQVLCKKHTLSNKAKNYNAGLDEKFEGPYIVHKKLSPVLFNLKDSKGRIIHNIHVRDLRPYINNNKA